MASTEDDNTFDKVEQDAQQRRTSEIKKNNLKAVFGSGPGRVALIVVVVVFVVLGAIGFMNLFKRKPVQQEQVANANAAMLNGPVNHGDVAVTNEQEAQLRREAANRDAEAAAAAGKPYLAPPIITKPAEENAATAGQPGAGPVGPGSREAAQNGAQNERNRQVAGAQGQGAAPGVQGQATQGNGTAPAPVAPQAPADWQKASVTPQILAVLGRSDEGKARAPFTTSAYALPDRTEKPATAVATQSGGVAPNVAAAANANANRLPFIQAGDGYYCETDTKINTDAARNDVLVTCHQGKLANARMIGKFEASNEYAIDGSVAISLTLLSIPGRASMPVQAVAFDEQSGDVGMADDVDNHGVRKYGGLALANLVKGFGKAASMVSGTTQTVSTGGQTVVTTSTEPMTAARQAKIAVGEVGIGFGESLARSSEKIKRTIKVGDKKGVRVVFLADVFDEKK